MEGEEYIALNPDSFYDDYWTYRNLQQLCMKLRLGGRGTREDLIMKLTMWHRERENFEEFTDDHYPMNVNGNNFSLLQINVHEISSKRKRRRSSLEYEDQTVKIDPESGLLRPIQRIRPDNSMNQNKEESHSQNILQTPTKGILKKKLPRELESTKESQENHLPLVNFNSPLPSRIHSTPSKPRLQFSPFNAIKIISHRYSSPPPSMVTYHHYHHHNQEDQRI